MNPLAMRKLLANSFIEKFFTDHVASNYPDQDQPRLPLDYLKPAALIRQPATVPSIGKIRP
jgi:hypothetical protein